ncbi:MAG TPA: PEGA domain-containing protein [Polyangiaceae bacterium]|jgi:hypothetical protein
MTRTRHRPAPAAFSRRALGAVFGALLAGCASSAKVPLRVSYDRKTTPRDASVIIDEEYVGPLYMVAAYGLGLPVGTHRVTVQKDGYFPWDKLVVADRGEIHLDVVLVPVPD